MTSLMPPTVGALHCDPCVPRSKHISQAQNAAKKHPTSETDGPGQWGGSRLRAPRPPLMVSVPLAGGIRHQVRHVCPAACAVPAHAGQGRAADRWLGEGQEGWPSPISPPRCSGGVGSEQPGMWGLSTLCSNRWAFLLLQAYCCGHGPIWW